ncbi:Gfo/Idh/MocA family protein [Roseomonas haemaphysalidis]|uniref:Gfo/Idh/MocA family oxidoreductase n=1 Tax=Roseomonas haemaphysalidis TaxID=2768162 RepID=A0ABS3KMQ3_9PROT|nr:Gfo/Idh/MocA family oxidoreductase [Roseomonas haemaphysalidis]MBO1078717.1 Gfo/Idh/MocA family oxidoreductase [Roseomonas haemaphysalidis]
MPDRMPSLSRRGLVGGASLLLAAGPAAAAAPPPTPADIGNVQGGRVTFPNWKGEADRPSPPPPNPMPPGERVGFAIVGLGRLSLEELLPAFAECKQARPVALVSGTPDKLKAVGAQYGIKPEALYSYADFDRIAENPEVKVVYIVLPNGLHHEYVLRAARAGKHVLCEKPMANTSAEAREMVAACRDARVKLMIAYRCQYEPYNRRATALLRDGGLGAARFMEASNTQVQGEVPQWRFSKALAGGGALPDIGLYCLNAARFYSGEEPVEVFARIHNTPDDPRYREVEESIAFMLRFPSGLMANCAASYGAHESKDMRVRLEKGWIDVENAFAYQGQSMRVATRDGKAEAIRELRLGQKNQFAAEIDHMAQCVLQDRVPRTPGEEGLQDQVIMEALYRSAETGAAVALPAVEGRDTTRGPALEEEE